MSHRRHKRTISDEQDEGLSLAEGIIWKLTAYTLARLKTGEDRARQPNLSPRDFYTALESMDETGRIIKRFDKNIMNSIAPEGMGLFFDFYATACITADAKELRAVDTLVKYGMIAFQNPAESEGPPAMADYPQLASILNPIKGEYPYFCNLFIGILQSRLERTLGNAGFLPPEIDDRILCDDKGAGIFPDGSKASFERRVELAKDFLTPRKLIGETSMAMIRFFKHEQKLIPNSARFG